MARVLFALLCVLAQPAAGSSYVFTTDWFSNNVKTWERVLRPLKGKPGIRYLEIGVFEGRSLIWVMENVFTHATARAVAVDVFPDSYLSTFRKNLERGGLAAKVEVRKGLSKDVLRSLPPAQKFDVIYIDGSHMARDVMIDAAFSWDLLKVGGILIFDDYLYRPHLPLDGTPKMMLDAFLTAFGNDIEILHHDYQLIVRKVENPCAAAECTVLGNQLYYHYDARVVDVDTGKSVQLSKQESALIARYLKEAKRFGEAKNRIVPHLLSDPEFQKLRKRIGLRLE